MSMIYLLMFSTVTGAAPNNNTNVQINSIFPTKYRVVIVN
jgi:hypothetical protein